MHVKSRIPNVSIVILTEHACESDQSGSIRGQVWAGLAARVDRYRWSSDRVYRSGSQQWPWLDRSFVLSALGEESGSHVRAYRQFLSESDSDELSSLFSRMRIPSVLGSKDFINRLKARFGNLRDNPEIPESRVFSPGIDLIKMAVCEEYGVDESDLLRSRRGTTNEARNVAIYLSRRLSGETLVRIGKEFQLNNYESVSSVVSRMKKIVSRYRKVRTRVNRVERALRKAQNQT